MLQRSNWLRVAEMRTPGWAFCLQLQIPSITWCSRSQVLFLKTESDKEKVPALRDLGCLLANETKPRSRIGKPGEENPCVIEAVDECPADPGRRLGGYEASGNMGRRRHRHRVGPACHPLRALRVDIERPLHPGAVDGLMAIFQNGFKIMKSGPQ